MNFIRKKKKLDVGVVHDDKHENHRDLITDIECTVYLCGSDIFKIIV